MNMSKVGISDGAMFYCFSSARTLNGVQGSWLYVCIIPSSITLLYGNMALPLLRCT